MSIENDLSSIAQYLAKIAAHMTAYTPVVVSDKAASSSHVTPVVQVAPTIERPTVQPVVQVVTQVAAPVFAAPIVTSPTDAPFANQAELTAFVMDTYKSLGPIKGAKIQEVLNGVGVKNINEVKPEMYAAVKAGIEALKG